MQCVGLPRQQIQTSLFIEFRRIQLCELSGQTLFNFRKGTSGQVLEYAPGIFKMGIPVYAHAAQRKLMLSAMYYPTWPLELSIDMAMTLQGLVLFLLLLFQLNWLREGWVEAGMM